MPDPATFVERPGASFVPSVLRGAASAAHQDQRIVPRSPQAAAIMPSIHPANRPGGALAVPLPTATPASAAASAVSAAPAHATALTVSPSSLSTSLDLTGRFSHLQRLFLRLLAILGVGFVVYVAFRWFKSYQDRKRRRNVSDRSELPQSTDSIAASAPALMPILRSFIRLRTLLRDRFARLESYPIYQEFLTSHEELKRLARFSGGGTPNTENIERLVRQMENCSGSGISAESSVVAISGDDRSADGYADRSLDPELSVSLLMDELETLLAENRILKQGGKSNRDVSEGQLPSMDDSKSSTGASLSTAFSAIQSPSPDPWEFPVSPSAFTRSLATLLQQYPSGISFDALSRQFSTASLRSLWSVLQVLTGAGLIAITGPDGLTSAESWIGASVMWRAPAASSTASLSPVILPTSPRDVLSGPSLLDAISDAVESDRLGSLMNSSDPDLIRPESSKDLLQSNQL